MTFKTTIRHLNLNYFKYVFPFKIIYLQTVLKVHFNEVRFLLTILKQDQESLSAPSMNCLCKTGTSSQSCFNQSKQDQEYLFVLSLNSLCRAGQTHWSGNISVHRTIW